jgi:hypothetical protein
MLDAKGLGEKVTGRIESRNCKLKIVTHLAVEIITHNHSSET